MPHRKAEHAQQLTGGKMKQLMFIAISMSCLSLSGCGGGGSGQAQAATPTTVVLDVTLAQFTASGTDGVQSVSCPPDASAISASCSCEIDAGVIFALEVDGNGAVCGCDLGTGPLATLHVTVTCSSLVFGTVLSGAAGGIELQPLPPSQPDANKVNEWAEKLKTKEAELMNARAARAR